MRLHFCRFSKKLYLMKNKVKVMNLISDVFTFELSKPNEVSLIS